MALFQPDWLSARASETRLPAAPSVTLPVFVSWCVYTTKPPGITCAEPFGTSVRLRTTLTVTWSCRRSRAAETGERERKYISVLPAAKPAGTVTSAKTVTLPPPTTAPVFVMMLFAPLRKVTDHPAGSAKLPNVESVLAARS